MFEMKNELINYEEYFSSEAFEKEYVYHGELGNFYTREETCFKVWNPVACAVNLKIYNSDGYITKDDLILEVPMKRGVKGVWEIVVEKDLKNKYYTYEYCFENIEKQKKNKRKDKINYKYIDKGNRVVLEAADMYGKASGTNGKRSMIIDLKETNPTGWESDKSPEFNKTTDAIIYELHVRDFSSDDKSGVVNKKKYIAFTEKNSKNEYGDSTCLTHIKELGVTHIHLLPIQDFGSIDEGDKHGKEYNWGYDPYNYNVPEGSYATDASDGKVRILELKQAIKAIHDEGMRVVLDVVYNHTYNTEQSLFDKAVPNYYHRTINGYYTNGSGCGNETASDRMMFRKYMIDSLKHWIKEYHVDGFRFDLMAVHDIETMKQIRKAMDEIDKSILLYGEGWIGGDSKLEYDRAAFKNNVQKLGNIAMFNDNGRDAVKGSVFIANTTGFATGAMYLDNPIYKNKEEIINNIKYMLAGSGEHPQVKTSKNGMKGCIYPWAHSPSQVINYVSAHDNMTLWDKIKVSHNNEDIDTLKKMNKLSMAIVLMSQGIPFIHAGDEILRSKKNPKCKLGFDDNSYRSNDNVNSIKWNDKTKHKDIFEYYKGLIAYRKYNELFKMTDRAEINRKVIFEEPQEGIIVCKIKDDAGKVKTINVFNGLNKDYIYELPRGAKWDLYVNDAKAGNKAIDTVQDRLKVKALSVASVMDS